MKTTCILALALLALAAAPSGAQDSMTMRGTSQAGRFLYYSPALGTNGLSCAHCHADFDEVRFPDGLIRPGHSLYNAAKRPTWWGQDPDSPGAYPDVATAAVVCVEHYMRNPKKLTAQQLLDLHAYLNAITTAAVVSPLSIAPAADKTGEYLGFEGGNRLDGRFVFFAACHSCHPNGNAGIAPAIPRDREPAFYARKIREGDGLGAVLSGVDPNAYDEASGQYMPFFGADLLTNQEIRDLIAYIKSLEPLPPPPPPPKVATKAKPTPKGKAATKAKP